jgi:hypothetical protein
MYAMIKRYLELEPLLDRNSRTLAPFIPCHMVAVTLKYILLTLELLEEAFQGLQKDNQLSTVLDAMATFKYVESVLSSRPEEDLFHSNFVDHPQFLSGIFKVKNHQEAILTEDEKMVLLPFKIPQAKEEINSLPPTTPDTSVSFRERARQYAGIDCKANKQSKYVPLDFIPPISCMVERLFSRTKLAFSDLRKKLKKRRLEAMMLLRYNDDLWGIDDLLVLTDPLRSTKPTEVDDIIGEEEYDEDQSYDDSISEDSEDDEIPEAAEPPAAITDVERPATDMDFEIATNISSVPHERLMPASSMSASLAPTLDLSVPFEPQGPSLSAVGFNHKRPLSYSL